MTNAPTGKGKKALDRLEAIDSQLSGVRDRLRMVAEALLRAFASSQTTTNLAETQKRRSAVGDLSARIEFTWNGLNLYIDFILSTSASDGLTSVEGCIVYGVNRPLCFAECLFPKTDGCEYCDRISRCDRFEDKPLARFSVDRDGIIKSSGELNDQWGILDTTKSEKTKKEENDKTVLDLHYRALDLIWPDALDWTNENILP